VTASGGSGSTPTRRGRTTSATSRSRYGICNADELAEDLGKWVVSWDGDTLARRRLVPAHRPALLRAATSRPWSDGRRDAGGHRGPKTAAARLARRPDEQRRRIAARTVGRSLSVYLGRVPAERHEHFDTDGNLTGWTVVTREPEWLDEDRRQMADLAEVEAGSCPGCGWHESLMEGDDNVFGPVDRVCPGVR
jgi:hypothetical protein